jgi:hypothetical protein
MSLENYGGMILTGAKSWFIHQSFLEILPADRLVAKQEELGKGNYEFGLWGIFVHTSKWFFLHAVKSYDVGVQLYISKGRHAVDFYFP